MSITYIIASYGGVYARRYNNKISYDDNNNMLKHHLKLLNGVKNNITKIVIMRPRISEHHEKIKNYYSIDKLDIPNIVNKVSIVDCENIGCSYGQWYQYLANENERYTDYYILTEDDYVGSSDNFDNKLVVYYNNKCNNSLLCSAIVRNEVGVPRTHRMHNKDVVVADFALCVLNTHTVKNMLKFNFIDYIITKVPKDVPLCYFQILFSYAIAECNINITEWSNKYLSIFYENATGKYIFGSFCTNKLYNDSLCTKKNDDKYSCPLFLPIQLFLDNNYNKNKKIIVSYIKKKHLHKYIGDKLNNIVK